MALFENFPYTNLHELNLDWLIQEMENLKELVQDGPVISVNGQTGVVTLYQEAQVRLPDVTDAQQTYWNIFRSLNGHLYGIRFDSNGNVYAIRDGIRTKLLTWADIPPDAGVISVNGLYGVVHISGTDIPWMGGENETIFDKLSENEDAIDNLNIVLGTLTNAIKAGIAYLEPNVDDTAIHNIPAGKYVFWKNYAYISTQAISIGDTLSSTNLQAVGEGGFINALQTELNSKFTVFHSDESKALSTSWTMVKDIEIPANTAYGFEAHQYFSNVEPKGIGVSLSGSLNTYDSMIMQDSNGSIISFTGYNSSSSPIHRYIFAKADGTGTNNIIIDGWLRSM